MPVSQECTSAIHGLLGQFDELKTCFAELSQRVEEESAVATVAGCGSESPAGAPPLPATALATAASPTRPAVTWRQANAAKGKLPPWQAARLQQQQNVRCTASASPAAGSSAPKLAVAQQQQEQARAPSSRGSSDNGLGPYSSDEEGEEEAIPLAKRLRLVKQRRQAKRQQLRQQLAASDAPTTVVPDTGSLLGLQQPVQLPTAQQQHAAVAPVQASAEPPQLRGPGLARCTAGTAARAGAAATAPQLDVVVLDSSEEDATTVAAAPSPTPQAVHASAGPAAAAAAAAAAGGAPPPAAPELQPALALAQAAREEIALGSESEEEERETLLQRLQRLQRQAEAAAARQRGGASCQRLGPSSAAEHEELEAWPRPAGPLPQQAEAAVDLTNSPQQRQQRQQQRQEQPERSPSPEVVFASERLPPPHFPASHSGSARLGGLHGKPARPWAAAVAPLPAEQQHCGGATAAGAAAAPAPVAAAAARGDLRFGSSEVEVLFRQGFKSLPSKRKLQQSECWLAVDSI